MTDTGARRLRMLFAFVGGHGHFEPLAAVARCAREAGHEVAFAASPGMGPAIRAAGFRALGPEERVGPPPRRLPLRPPDAAREERDLRERFVRRAARARVPLLLERCADWRPDLLVADETDFGASIAAERLGLPFALLLVIATGSLVRPEVVAEALDELRAEHGLPPDPALERPARQLVLAPFPPSFRDPARPLPPTAVSLQPSLAAPAEGIAATAGSAWRPPRPGAPTVYATLGTVFNTESGDLLARLVAGLRELPVGLVVTVGPAIEPAELGPQPAHVRVERHVALATVLPHCALVVCHGGSGTLMGALAQGLPSLIVPLGADQPANAERCATLGVADVLDAMRVTPELVRDRAAALLASRAHRRGAQRLREEIAALPGPASAVPLLEGLARGARSTGRA